MRGLSLRLRVFLFFVLLALGGVAAITVGAVVGYRQFGDLAAFSSFVTTAVIGGLGLTGLTLAVWLLFDENVSKPVEALAASVRVRVHADVHEEIEAETAKYLGDLAPAVTAIHQKLAAESQSAKDIVVQRTARLEAQRAQLLQILSDIPIAVIVARSDHQIVLYDGQAAELMERACPARLNSSVLDYLEESSISDALKGLDRQNVLRREIAVKSRSGVLYKGHIRTFGKSAGYTLMLEPLTPDAARPLVYDFDLLEKDQTQDFNTCALKDLTFVVFDSETTGLDPSTDEVVQLGAVRILNGKLVEGETFDMLVAPKRPIPPASTKVHGVTDAMVADAPDFSVACESFHKYAENAVIVAHNAPFDMSFLRRQTKGTELNFDNPVLDTVHLSAVVFGGSAEHTLDALCQRFDITIPQELRHTALGDAIATANAFIAMVAVLEARGFQTLEQVRSEVRKHSRILSVDA